MNGRDSDLENTLRSWGERQVSATSSVQVPVERLGRSQHGRARAVAGAIAAVVVVALVSVLVRVAGSSQHHHASDRTAAAGNLGRFGALILHDGDTVQANSLVVAAPGKPVRFCDANAIYAGVARSASSSTPPLTCGANDLELKGVKLASLAKRQIQDGTLAGFADIRGIYRHRAVTVTRQTAPSVGIKPITSSLPCSVPPLSSLPRAVRESLSGNGPELAITGYGKAHPGAVVDFGLLRSSVTATVAYVLATGDLAPIRAALLPVYGEALCVTQSHYTRPQVIRALDFMDAVRGPGFEGGREGIGPDGQDLVQIQVVSVTPTLARKAAAFPDGLIELEPWLRPVRP